VSAARMRELTDDVRLAAEQISRELGWEGPSLISREGSRREGGLIPSAPLMRQRFPRGRSSQSHGYRA